MAEVTNRTELDAVIALMRDFPHPWGVGGGWALDLFLDRETRVHEDIEVILFRDCQQAFRDLFPSAELEQVTLVAGIPAWQPWPEGYTVELPFHQIRARLPNGVTVEALMNDRHDGIYMCRRHDKITLPEEKLWLWTAEGVPFLAPEIQLLHKAKYHREKDERDFEATVPRLSEAQLTWLREGLRLAHSDDPWLQRL